MGTFDLNLISRRDCFSRGLIPVLAFAGSKPSQSQGWPLPAQTKRCIFIFLFGGPSHIDLFDMKPRAVREIRGDFNPSATAVPGIQICEHLPRLAKEMKSICLVRSMCHRMNVHGPACSEIYSGREYFGPPVTDQARREDWPSLASLVARFKSPPNRMPVSVVLPWYSQFVGQDKRIAGQTGGRMGEKFNPLLIQAEPELPGFDLPDFRLNPDIGPGRMAGRKTLLLELQKGQARGRNAQFTDMAWDLMENPGFSKAIDLRSIPAKLREKYGMTRFGQSLLMAAQLVQAGVSLVTVNWDDESRKEKVSPHWDTHNQNFQRLKNPLCPLFDQSFPTLIEDLRERGLLDSTLVVAVGEFGRTPKIGQFTQNSMTENSGRDHWPHAFTALLAGGPAPRGAVYGATNDQGAYVKDLPVSPADLSATVMKHLGVNPHWEYHDQFQNMSQFLCEGNAIQF
ncbi:MAG: DUF1501 domain-containing protein [Gemmataceae bacterium]|nr:DUF1501 domain-containing protein [Gemmataceae bacterium]